MIAPSTTRLFGRSSTRVRRTFKLTGTLSPSTASGKVTIAVTRLVGGVWKSAGRVRVAVVRGKFSYSVKPRHGGKWRFVARYPGGVAGATKYLSSKSAAKTVRVK